MGYTMSETVVGTTLDHLFSENMNRRIIFGAMCLMFVLCIIVPPLASWFMLVRLSPLQLLCAGVGIVLIPLVQNGLFYIFERLTFTRPDLP